MSDKFQTYPLHQVDDPEHYDIVIKEHYWAVDKIGNVLKFKGASWQCNRNKGIVDRFIKDPDHPGVEVRFIESAFVPERLKNDKPN